MKKLLYLFVGLVAISSCNEKIDFQGAFKETVVVYGLLDQADSLHYVKVNRAFIGPGNALDIAQIPDSNYFDDVEVTVSEYLDGNLSRTWVLRDTLVNTKDTNGVFYAPQEKVYYFKTLPTGINESIQTSTDPQQSSLNRFGVYKLSVVVDGGKYTVSGQTELVRGITSPATSQNFTFKFADDPAEYISTGVTASNTGNSFVLNANLDVEFYEHEGTNVSVKSFNWLLGEADVLPNSSKTFSALGATFYDLIAANKTSNPSIDKRTFKGMWITFTGGSEDLYNYIVVNRPSSSLAQSKPSYTNLTINNGGNVLGIFSSRQTLRVYKPFYTSPQQAYIRAIDKKSTRELCLGPKTGMLLFCSNHPGDNVVNQEEAFACQ